MGTDYFLWCESSKQWFVLITMKASMKKLLLLLLFLLPPRDARAMTKQDALLLTGVIGTAAGYMKVQDKEDVEKAFGVSLVVLSILLIINSDTLAKI
jgi:hypothetical protein